MVIATQNPIEHEGTYPLPESQLDRFLMRISVGYPARTSELEILDTHGDHDALDDIGPVVTAADVQRHGRRRQGRARGARPEGVPRRPGQRVAPPSRTSRSACRPAPRSPCSGSPGPAPPPSGRTYVVPDDLKALAEPVLAHRLLVTPEAQLQGITAADALAEVLRAVPVPAGKVAVSAAVLTRQGWLVGLGAVALLRRRPAPRARSSCSSSAWWPPRSLVGCRRPRRHRAPRARGRAGRAPRPRPRRHRQPGRAHRPQPRRHRHAGAAAARPRHRHPGRRPPRAAAGPRRAHRRRLPAAHRPAGPRADRAARRRRGRPLRAHQPRHGGRADGRSSPSTRTSTRSTRSPTPPATTRWPAPASRTRSAAPARTSTRCGPYVVGDDLRRVHWPSPPATTSCSSARTSCPGRAAPRCCSTCAGRPRRRLARGGGVGGREHRVRHRPPPRPGAPRHHRRHRLGLRAGLRPRRGDHGAPRGRARRPHRQPAPRRSRCSAGAPPAGRWSSSSPRCPATTSGPSLHLRSRYGSLTIVHIDRSAWDPGAPVGPPPGGPRRCASPATARSPRRGTATCARGTRRGRGHGREPPGERVRRTARRWPPRSACSRSTLAAVLGMGRLFDDGGWLGPLAANAVAAHVAPRRCCGARLLAARRRRS